jgi:hypothetical protein
MKRWRENRGNHPRTEVRGFGKRHCRVVTRVYPDPLVKLVKTRRKSLLHKEVNLHMEYSVDTKRVPGVDC